MKKIIVITICLILLNSCSIIKNFDTNEDIGSPTLVIGIKPKLEIKKTIDTKNK